jgi:hypothetical protein
LGDNRGISIDPSYTPDPANGTADGRLTFIQDYYSEKYAGQHADFIASRHTLEHIQYPTEFMTTVRRTIGKRLDSVVFFEVPNARFTLHDLAIWDIIYEHCSYFTDHSLAYLFARSGFTVKSVQPTFAGQFLCIEALPAGTPHGERSADEVQTIADEVAVFADRYRHKVDEERSKLEQWRQQGQKVVLWGAGSKGITFLNVLGQYGQIEYAVDINPRKRGMFVTGAGQEIVPPAFLPEYQPDIVLLMNPVYLAEVQQTLDGMGVKAQIVPAL